MKLIITIDTEEDNWGCFTRQGHTVKNVERIPDLQELFDRYHVKPTYLLAYPVVANDKASSILTSIVGKGRCEIGSHCHPWNTPPFEEVTSPRNSMLCNLPAKLQYQKIKCLHEAIRQRFDTDPISFRSGRWGYNAGVAKSLQDLGYKIDTSITPYMDWSDEQGPNFSEISPRPFKFSCDNIFEHAPDGALLEVPATVGFFQSNFTLCNGIFKLLTRKPLKRMVLHAVLHKLNLLNRVWLSPEVADAETMIRLARRMRKNDYKLVNLFFHSPSLKHGLTPFVRTKDEERTFLRRIREFLIFATDTGITSISLSEALSVAP